MGEKAPLAGLPYELRRFGILLSLVGVIGGNRSDEGVAIAALQPRAPLLVWITRFQNTHYHESRSHFESPVKQKSQYNIIYVS